MAIWMTGRHAAPVSLAIALLFGSAEAPVARQTSTFVIAAAQGYGVEDCLAEGGECGHVVADAWCEAHGRGEAVSFGRSEGEQTALRPYFITCGD